MRPVTGEVSVWMDAAPEKVWGLVSDVTRIGEFSPETFEAKWTHGASEPAVGARFKGHVRRNGVGPIYWSSCEVTACDPERNFEFAVVIGKPVNFWGYRLQPHDGGTNVTEYFRVEPNPALRVYWALLGGLRGRTNERGMRTTLERMKAAVES